MTEQDTNQPKSDQNPQDFDRTIAPIGRPTSNGPIGKMMGQFQILEEIGRGGMATVYRATQRSMNRTVAIKLLPQQMLHDPSFYDRFLREVDVISRLEHPHILPIYDYGQSEGLPFIAMRYLGGGSLEQRIRKGPMSLQEIERPLRQVGQALDYAHQQGIIHRDLKPGNIMLDESGNAYLSDFGIARVLGSEMTGSMIIGTPAYMSPEQANGVQIDARSDIYSLGIVLFELITGRGPFQAETPMAVLLKHITEPVPPISNFRKDIPYAVEEVVRRAVAKDPGERFSSAGEFAEAFSRAMRDEPTEKYPPLNRSTPGSPANVARATSPSISSPTSAFQPMTGDEPAARKRPVGLFVMAAVIVLVVLGGGIFAVTQMGNNKEKTPLEEPFLNSTVLDDPEYTISMFNDWIPPEETIDLSSDLATRHVWKAPDNTVYVSLTIMLRQLDESVSMIRFIDTFLGRVRGTNLPEEFRLEGGVAENGTVRRSFRIPAVEDPALLPFPDVETPGQLDIFFIPGNDGSMAILEMYTADSTGNQHIETLQKVLDSLRLKI